LMFCYIKYTKTSAKKHLEFSAWVQQVRAVTETKHNLMHCNPTLAWYSKAKVKIMYTMHTITMFFFCFIYLFIFSCFSVFYCFSPIKNLFVDFFIHVIPIYVSNYQVRIATIIYHYTVCIFAVRITALHLKQKLCPCRNNMLRTWAT